MHAFEEVCLITDFVSNKNKKNERNDMSILFFLH
jgi:hypothetical protein